MRAVTEIQADLAEVKTAISAALTAQSYTGAHGQSKQMASLAALEARERRLQDELDIALGRTTGGIVWNQGVRIRD